jgi:translation initiation factor 2B subunit (eIF-2B alpha/beta/delta family)
MTTTKTTAASLIDQILDKHNEVEQAEQKAVAPAVACGKLLRLAKESVKAERKKWKDWLEANSSSVKKPFRSTCVWPRTRS